MKTQPFVPGSFALFVEIPGEKVGQAKGTTYRRRIGNYKTRAFAEAAAKSDAEYMERTGKSLNWLIGAPTPGGRVYRIFEATSWAELT